MSPFKDLFLATNTATPNTTGNITAAAMLAENSGILLGELAELDEYGDEAAKGDEDDEPDVCVVGVGEGDGDGVVDS